MDLALPQNNSFLKHDHQSSSVNTDRSFRALPCPAVNELAARIPTVGRLLVIMDRDGTIDSIRPDNPHAHSIAETIKVLQRISALSDVTVALASGRSVEFLREKVGALNIIYFGEQGAQRGRGYSTFLDREPSVEVKRAIEQIAEEFFCRASPDLLAQVDPEIKPNSFAVGCLRYPARESELSTLFHDIIACLNVGHLIELEPGFCMAEAKPRGVNKASALQELLEEEDYCYIICAGNDLPDRAMLLAAATSEIPSTVIVVGEAMSPEGCFRLSTPENLREFLHLVAAAREKARH